MDFQLLLSSFIYQQLDFYDYFVWKSLRELCLSLTAIILQYFLPQFPSVNLFQLMSPFSSRCLHAYRCLLQSPSTVKTSVNHTYSAFLSLPQCKIVLFHVLCHFCNCSLSLTEDLSSVCFYKLSPLDTCMIDGSTLSRLHTVTYKMCISNLCYIAYHGFYDILC